MVKRKNNAWFFEPKSQKISRYVGLLVFLLGVGLLIFTFYTAYAMFSDINRILPDQHENATLNELIIRIVFALLLLFAMGLVSSIIALRGADLLSISHQKMPVNRDRETDENINEDKEKDAGD